MCHHVWHAGSHDSDSHSGLRRALQDLGEGDGDREATGIEDAADFAVIVSRVHDLCERLVLHVEVVDVLVVIGSLEDEGTWDAIVFHQTLRRAVSHAPEVGSEVNITASGVVWRLQTHGRVCFAGDGDAAKPLLAASHVCVVTGQELHSVPTERHFDENSVVKSATKDDVTHSRSGQDALRDDVAVQRLDVRLSV